MRLTLSLCVFFSLGTSGLAAECSRFEREAADLLWHARQFQKTNKFQEYGWSKAGPTNGWLPQFKAARNDEAELSFFRKYEASFADIYMVADTYRTEGRLDDFWQDVDGRLSGVLNCK